MPFKKRIWDFAGDIVDKNPPGDTGDMDFIPDKDNYNMIPLIRGIFFKKKESGQEAAHKRPLFNSCRISNF